jgi:hypothetical protein
LGGNLLGRLDIFVLGVAQKQDNQLSALLMINAITGAVLNSQFDASPFG